MEKLDASTESWTTLNILAQIAEIEGNSSKAQTYRQRECEAYAAFTGNRYQIDNLWGKLIASIAAAANGNQGARTFIEAKLPEIEAKGWKITAAIRQIWDGERDWYALTEELDRENALVVLRILEEIENPTIPLPNEGVLPSAK